MSKDPIDKWLDAMQFEIFRLKSTNNPLSTEVLESRIKQLESMPVTKGTRQNLKEKFHQLESLKCDLQSLRVLESSCRKMQQLKDSYNKGMLDVKEMAEVLHKLDTSFEKTKIEERERRRQHLASLMQLWPKADVARKRRMVGLFATYAGMSLRIEISNSVVGIPQKIARWAVRGYKRHTGLR